MGGSAGAGGSDRRRGVRLHSLSSTRTTEPPLQTTKRATCWPRRLRTHARHSRGRGRPPRGATHVRARYNPRPVPQGRPKTFKEHTDGRPNKPAGAERWRRKMKLSPPLAHTRQKHTHTHTNAQWDVKTQAPPCPPPDPFFPWDLHPGPASPHPLPYSLALPESSEAPAERGSSLGNNEARSS